MRRAPAFALAALAALAAAPAARAAGPAVRIEGPRAGARVEPANTELGERVTYRGVIEGGNGARVRFLQPKDEGALHWGAMTSTTHRGSQWGPGTEKPDARGWVEVGGGMRAMVEIPLQVFALGKVAVPGIEFELDQGGGPVRHRLPLAQLTVIPVIAAGDTAADFRRLHGPLAAPWWERVPWRLVVIGLAAIAAVVVMVWLARRRKKPVAAAAAAPRPRRDPVTEALRDLATLRRLNLPAAGRFNEHAFHLTRILRRFFEATVSVPRPGDTTPELVRHLAEAALDPSELQQVDGLLRVWDRVKFAQAPSTREEAERAESAVEAIVRRRGAPSEGKAA